MMKRKKLRLHIGYWGLKEPPCYLHGAQFIVSLLAPDVRRGGTQTVGQVIREIFNRSDELISIRTL